MRNVGSNNNLLNVPLKSLIEFATVFYKKEVLCSIRVPGFGTPASTEADCCKQKDSFVRKLPSKI